MRLVILGAGGQVGEALNRIADTVLEGCEVIILSSEELDLTRPETVKPVLSAIQPEAVINAAAYTAVDKAESEVELCRAINATGPAALARFCRERDIPLVHYSTDYVFEGSGSHYRSEGEETGPLNVYGLTKLEGEQAIVAEGGKYLIFRVSWVYDATGKNFVNTMMRLGAERESLSIVADQIGAPCFAGHLAEGTLACLKQAMEQPHFPSGIYHMVHQGETSWYGFAEAIFKAARQRHYPLKVSTLHPIATADYPTPARRPLNSRLNGDKLEQIFGIRLPQWEEGLEACMEEKGEYT
jgi:dTDP-4-dehydrorhamnose reductase